MPGGLKKGKKCVYGYKGNPLINNNYGLVQAIEVTPANVHDGKMLIPLVNSIPLPENTEVLVDKNYCGQTNEKELKDKNLVSKIMHKKQRVLKR